MSIEYTFTFQRQDVEAKVMEFLYQSEGRRDFYIGMPLPSPGQDPLEIIRAYAPVQAWLDDERPVVPVPEDLAGTAVAAIAPPTEGAASVANSIPVTVA